MVFGAWGFKVYRALGFLGFGVLGFRGLGCNSGVVKIMVSC